MKKCERGASCPFQTQQQHIQEFSHDPADPATAASAGASHGACASGYRSGGGYHVIAPGDKQRQDLKRVRAENDQKLAQIASRRPAGGEYVLGGGGPTMFAVRREQQREMHPSPTMRALQEAERKKKLKEAEMAQYDQHKARQREKAIALQQEQERQRLQARSDQDHVRQMRLMRFGQPARGPASSGSSQFTYVDDDRDFDDGGAGAEHEHDEYEDYGSSIARGAFRREEEDVVRACPHCTFHNRPAATLCEMCGLAL
eukprot:m.56321 g.56321  ORF g.56321 m.56321 type:complete len:258 (+) comp12030_c0_seq1:108-881(+)